VGGPAVDLDAEHEDALGLDPDVQIGGLSGDGEVAAEPPVI